MSPETTQAATTAGHEFSPAALPRADAQIRATTALSPAQIEQHKTRQQKAEDVIYTLNHSITCLSVTDIFGLSLAANAVNSIFKTSWNPAHDHNHGYGALNWTWDRITGKHNDPAHIKDIASQEHDRIHGAQDHGHGDAHAPHKHEHTEFKARELRPDSTGKRALGKFWETSRIWLVSEAIGDLGSVPVTIGIQRFFPGFMHTLRKGIEACVGWAFHKTTDSAGRAWGQKHGYGADSQEVKDRSHQLYEYEMSHMPQMAVWTVSSVLMNYAAMHALHAYNPKHFEKMDIPQFAAVKGAGAAMTAGLVLSVRGATPGGAHKWDQSIGKHVIVPITKTVGGIFGVKSADVDAFQKNRDDMEGASIAKETQMLAKTEERPIEPATKVTGIEAKGPVHEPQHDVAVAG